MIDRIRSFLGSVLGKVGYRDGVIPEGKYVKEIGQLRFQDKKPVLGEKWRHFKGGEYWIIAIARHYQTGEMLVIYASDQGLQLPLLARHTETEDIFSLYDYQGEVIAGDVYFDSEDRIVWARPLDNFMGVVSHPCGAGSINCYRFERC